LTSGVILAVAGPGGGGSVTLEAIGAIRTPSRQTKAYVYHWLVTVLCVSGLVVATVTNYQLLREHWLTLVPWVLALAVANLVPIKGRYSAHLVPDAPIVIAAALVLPPAAVLLIAFVGACDLKEFRRQLPWSKALFNRSQIALVTALAALAAHTVDATPSKSALILPIAGVVWAIFTVGNYAFVAEAISLEHGHRVVEVARQLKLGTSGDFLLTFASWAVMGAMLAALYDRTHLLALLAFVCPILLSRQALMRSQMLVDTRRAYRSREQALTLISQSIYDERSEERRMIAADLHDEVLQPLFKVSLMAQVLKADLATGRLLEMDQDLPELLTAAEIASTTLRELIGDLRRSALGIGGLKAALPRLLSSVSDRTSITTHSDMGDVSLSPGNELAIYQIAKEAIGNALAHSKATNLWAVLRDTPEGVLLMVRDDGVGFDPLVEHKDHYGVEIMRERAAAIGAQFYLDSSRGEGCTVVLILPATPERS
jgi:signal transduction histidine kinase